MHHSSGQIAAALLLVSLLASIVTAEYPPSNGETNGLDDNEFATLWSRDVDHGNGTRYWAGNRTAVQRVAAQTDITFKRPPDTAATWTQNDHEDFEPGGENTSVHPPHANLTDSTLIKDAHSTIFAIQPSTRGHLDPTSTPLYVAPEGHLLGVVDYRVETPAGQNWTRVNDEITEVRVKQDDTVVARTDGTHAPRINYTELERSASTLTLEAEIAVAFQNTTAAASRQANGTPEVVTDTVVVSDSVPVTVYDLRVSTDFATYPDGDTGVAIYQNRPWQSYQLTSDGTVGVRGVWRFYTARDKRWDTLVRTTNDGNRAVDSDVVPVYVHAFPSVLGPQAEPERTGPEFLSVWGIDQPTPTDTIGDNVHVGVVNDSYTASYGIAVRHDTIAEDTITVHGIVRGVNSTIDRPSEDAHRQVRRSELRMRIVSTNGSRATVRLELRDAKTGEPIGLKTAARRQPIAVDDRDGYITIAGKRVRTNASGVAITTVEGYGSYTARYQPESWLSFDPAYVGDRATVRYHPLFAFDGWVKLLVEILWQLLPFALALYTGLKLSSLFSMNERGEV